MNKHIMFSIFSLYGSLCSAQAVHDTTLFSKELNEIIVVAPENKTNGGNQMFYPSIKLKQATNNGIQLLAGLQIPELIIDPASGTIEKLGGGSVSLRINGRPASKIDLTSISSKDILKVEYISDPGAGMTRQNV